MNTHICGLCRRGHIPETEYAFGHRLCRACRPTVCDVYPGGVTFSPGDDDDDADTPLVVGGSD